MQKVESWPQLQDAIKTSSVSTNIVTKHITLSAALQSVNPLLYTLFLWLLVFLIQVILLQVVLIQVDSVKV